MPAAAPCEWRKSGDVGERGDLLVLPQAEVAVRDAAFRQDSGRLDDHEAEPAKREPPKMDEVPVIGDAVLRRILAHGCNDGAVAKREITQFQRREQEGHRWALQWIAAMYAHHLSSASDDERKSCP